MDVHQIAYFVAITILLFFTLYMIIKNDHPFGLKTKEVAIILLLATVLIMYQYSYSNGYIKF